MTMDFNKLDQAAIDTLRLLAVDMIEAAQSGHPGLPLGASPMAYVLLTRFLKQNPQDPNWPNRDRFVLSAGHGSALLYAWLHLAGYGLTIDDLKNFRQLNSKTPGHPEYGHTLGVEATTGPLGQGFAMGVGMALAEAYLAKRYNQPEFSLFDYYTYALVSDGDLMEGVASEAASLAGNLGLNKLIYLYDDNDITIEGRTDLTFCEEVNTRFQAYGWQVVKVADGNNLESIAIAIANAKNDLERPSLIMIKTKIGYGSPKEDTAAAHGAPLGPTGAAETRAFFGRPTEETFIVSSPVQNHCDQLLEKQKAGYQNWHELKNNFKQSHPELNEELDFIFSKKLPQNWADNWPEFDPNKKIATRISAGEVLNNLAKKIPWLMGGSADLSPSTKTTIENESSFAFNNKQGRNIHFGIREAAMGAILNGMSLSGLIPFGSTFLVFSDYLKPALRLSALMKTKVIYIFTHDSLGVGEDGPTHQPIEHLAGLRAIPNLCVFRPADAYESMAAWKVAISNQGPTALILSRQNLTVLDPQKFPLLTNGGPEKGAYILSEAKNNLPQAIILATGSEVEIALEAQAILLTADNINTRVVSLPSWSLFKKQSQSYQEQVLPPKIKARVSIEAGCKMGWEQFVGEKGIIIGHDDFGLSAPSEEIYEMLGFTSKNIVESIKKILKN